MKNYKCKIYGLLMIIWMLVVFIFSNQPAEKSSKVSGGITEKVVHIITNDNDKITQTQRDQIETIIRKCAHFVLYTIGGFLAVNYISTTKVQGKNIYIYAIIFTFVYAITDELHQLFVLLDAMELLYIFLQQNLVPDEYRLQLFYCHA